MLDQKKKAAQAAKFKFKTVESGGKSVVKVAMESESPMPSEAPVAKKQDVFSGLDASGKVADKSALQGTDWSGGGGGNNEADKDGYDFM